MNNGLWKPNLAMRPRRGSVPTWTGHGWESLRFCGARYYNSLGQSVGNASVTTLNYDTKQWDTHVFYEAAKSLTRLTVPYGCGGVYRIGANVQWQSNMGAVRMILGITASGTEIAAVEMAGVGTPDTPAQAVTTTYKLRDGDYVEAYVYQDTGGTRTVNFVAYRSPALWLYRVAPVAER